MPGSFKVLYNARRYTSTLLYLLLFTYGGLDLYSCYPECVFGCDLCTYTSAAFRPNKVVYTRGGAD